MLQADPRSSDFDEWAYTGTSRVLRLSREQQHSAQAMVLAVAQRGAVFLQNGVCLLFISPFVSLMIDSFRV